MRYLVAVLLALLLSSCAAMSPEALAASAKDKNAVVACGQANGPWGRVVTVYVDTNRIADNNAVSVDAECKVSVSGTKAPPK